MPVARFVVPPEFPSKIEQVLPMVLPVHPLRTHDALLKARAVKVNGRTVSAGRKVLPGDAVEVTLADPQPMARCEGPPVQVLAEAADLLIVEKPSGQVVDDESSGPRAQAPRGVTLVTLLASQQAGFSVGGYAAPGVVHRIDRETSGCVSLAKTDAALFELQRAFAEKRVTKRYLALVQGAPATEGQFDTPYGPRENNRRLFTTRLETPRRARLSYQVREQLRGAALVEVALDTGRTHQIRVQFSEAGHPLLGDALYGAGATPTAPRVMLHAEMLEIRSQTGVVIAARAPLPADFQQAVDALRG